MRAASVSVKPEGLHPCPSYPGWYATADGQAWWHQRDTWHGPYTSKPIHYGTAKRAHRWVKIHQLVADAFHGPCPDGYEVNHKDRRKDNTTQENLEYLTSRQNIIHYAKLMGYQTPCELLDGYQLPKDLWVETPNPRLARMLEHCRTWMPERQKEDSQ